LIGSQKPRKWRLYGFLKQVFSKKDEQL